MQVGSPRVERLLQGRDDRVGRCARLDRVTGTIEQDRELIAPESGAGVIVGHARLQPSGDLLQERIPGDVAEAVVGPLEPVRFIDRTTVPRP